MIIVFGSFTSAIVPVPPTSVHVPTPGASGVVAVRLVLETGSQNDWSTPAFASAAFGSKTNMVTRSLVIASSQGPLLNVHWKIFSPTGRLETSVSGSLMSAISPPP